jgi:uncharacterized cupin superfamily protein
MENGNTTTQDQNIVIDDTTAPVADASSLADVTAQCSVTSLTAPTATDNCAGSVTVTNNASLPITTQGTTVVTWTFTDGKWEYNYSRSEHCDRRYYCSCCRCI